MVRSLYTLDEVKDAARTHNMKLVDYWRYEEYPVRDTIIKDISDDYGGVAYSSDTFRLYECGIWNAVNDHVILQVIQKRLEILRQMGRANPTEQAETRLLRGLKSQLYRDPTLWNSNPHVLVFQNTAFDTDSMEPVEHDPEHYATSGLPFDYDSDAKAPTWAKVIHDLLSEDEREFLQEFAGYCLTNSVQHQMALWLVGPRGGGKSTLIRGLETMLGGGSLVGSLGLSQLQGSGARFALSNVPGKTLMTCTENPQTHIKATDTLNALITGDTLQVERKGKDSFDYRSTAKFLWAMNSLPGLYDANNGLFRRIHILRIDRMPVQKDPTIVERIQSEGAGIINWALKGLARLNERGYFEYPESVKQSTNEFIYQNDLFKQFLDEWTRRPVDGQPYEPKDYITPASELVENFNRWLSKSGFEAHYTTKSTKAHWERLGLTHKRTSQGYVWIGAGLNGESLAS